MIRAAGALLVALAAAGCGGPSLRSERSMPTRLSVDAAHASQWISRYRAEHGLAAVIRDPALDGIAQAQADAMAAADLLSHSVAGPLPDRLARLDRQTGAAAENVSAGYPDLDAALGGWRRSPEHDRNLLLPPLRRIGVAGASAPGTRFKTFWALVMTD